MTTIPDAIESAARHIGDDGELPYGARLSLYAALSTATGDRWRRVSVDLELACANRVSGIWQRRYPSNSTPREALSVAEQASVGRILRSAAVEGLGRCQTRLDDVLGEADPDFAPVYAGFAALVAAWSVIDGFLPKAGESEMSIDPLDWTAAFYGSLAECGGATWEGPNIGDSARRRAYWEWYLRNAIPQVASS